MVDKFTPPHWCCEEIFHTPTLTIVKISNPIIPDPVQYSGPQATQFKPKLCAAETVKYELTKLIYSPIILCRVTPI